MLHGEVEVEVVVEAVQCGRVGVGPVVVGDGQRAHEEGLERRRHAQVLLGGQGRRLSQQGDRGASMREPHCDGRRRGGQLVKPLRASWVCVSLRLP